METKIQSKYKHVAMTELKLYPNKHLMPTPWYKRLFKVLKKKQPEEVYNNKVEFFSDGTFRITIEDPDPEASIREFGKEIKLHLVPGQLLFASPDLIKKVKSIANQKRKKEWWKIRKYLP